MRRCLFYEVEIKCGFRSKNILFPVCYVMTADFERVFIVAALARFTKNTKRLVFLSN